MKKYIVPETVVVEIAHCLPIALSNLKLDGTVTIESGEILVKENLVDEEFWNSPFED